MDGGPVAETDLPRVLTQYRPEVFEPLADAVLYRQHNEITFYTWGDGRNAACRRARPGRR